MVTRILSTFHPFAHWYLKTNNLQRLYETLQNFRLGRLVDSCLAYYQINFKCEKALAAVKEILTKTLFKGFCLGDHFSI